jgi:hypothetical protein
MLKMMGMAMLTFSHTLSFASFHSTGSPGIVLGKGDNEDSKGKFNKGKGMDYSEQMFLTHSFCPFTGSEYHGCWAGSLGWAGWVGTLGPVRLSWVQSGCWVIGLGRVIGLGPVQLGHWVGFLDWAGSSGWVVGLGHWALAREMMTTTSKVMCNCTWLTIYI